MKTFIASFLAAASLISSVAMTTAPVSSMETFGVRLTTERYCYTEETEVNGYTLTGTADYSVLKVIDDSNPKLKEAVEKDSAADREFLDSCFKKSMDSIDKIIVSGYSSNEFELDSTMMVFRNDDKVLSYTLGYEACPWTYENRNPLEDDCGTIYRNYDAATGKHLTLDDIVKDKEAFLRLIKDEVIRLYEAGDMAISRPIRAYFKELEFIRDGIEELPFVITNYGLETSLPKTELNALHIHYQGNEEIFNDNLWTGIPETCFHSFSYWDFSTGSKTTWLQKDDLFMKDTNDYILQTTESNEHLDEINNNFSDVIDRQAIITINGNPNTISYKGTSSLVQLVRVNGTSYIYAWLEHDNDNWHVQSRERIYDMKDPLKELQIYKVNGDEIKFVKSIPGLYQYYDEDIWFEQNDRRFTVSRDFFFCPSARETMTELRAMGDDFRLAKINETPFAFCDHVTAEYYVGDDGIPVMLSDDYSFDTNTKDFVEEDDGASKVPHCKLDADLTGKTVKDGKVTDEEMTLTKGTPVLPYATDLKTYIDVIDQDGNIVRAMCNVEEDRYLTPSKGGN